jgi:hypothetical protein
VNSANWNTHASVLLTTGHPPLAIPKLLKRYELSLLFRLLRLASRKSRKCFVATRHEHRLVFLALLPRQEDQPVLIDPFIVWKAVYELQYELNSRPELVPIALHSLVQLIDIRGNS